MATIATPNTGMQRVGANARHREEIGAYECTGEAEQNGMHGSST
jgi:hypothetical protein